MIFKAQWLFNIDFFIDDSIEEDTLNIHLKQFESTHTSLGQQQPYSF